jgi:hypothetical protein
MRIAMPLPVMTTMSVSVGSDVVTRTPSTIVISIGFVVVADVTDSDPAVDSDAVDRAA